MQENTKKLNKIITNIYKVFATKCTNTYSDLDWHNVFECIHLLEYLNGINHIEISSGKYYNYLDFDNDKIPYREYLLNITTDYGYIAGKVTCCSAGTIDDPFKQYDLVISVQKDKDKNTINESISNISDNYFKQELSKIDNFKDLKKLVIKYCKRGFLAGTLLTYILCSFTLKNTEKQELMQSAYNIECENYTTEEEDTKEISPEWEQVCNDVEATIYHATKAQCNNQPNITASLFQLDMTNPQGHKIIAMERTMMKQYNLNYGDIVKISGTKLDGIYQIQDTMNKRFKGKHKIDILVNKDIKFGKWQNVKLYKLTNYNDCKDQIKELMNDAINQTTIDKRQSK